MFPLEPRSLKPTTAVAAESRHMSPLHRNQWGNSQISGCTKNSLESVANLAHCCCVVFSENMGKIGKKPSNSLGNTSAPMDWHVELRKWWETMDFRDALYSDRPVSQSASTPCCIEIVCPEPEGLCRNTRTAVLFVKCIACARHRHSRKSVSVLLSGTAS